MQTLLVLLLALIMSDGFPNEEDVPALFSGNRVVGDVYPQGADQPAQRLVDSVIGAGLFTTNSDPNTVGVDPLTGEDAPVGTDVGFGAAIRRYIQTGVLNGDFSIPPPDTSLAISDDNPLPYWTWTPDGGGIHAATLEADAGYASGRKLVVTAATSGAATSSFHQFVPVPVSQGQQYRVLASAWADDSVPFPVDVFAQFYTSGLATIGSEVAVPTPSSGGYERKADLGLVPPTASYLKLRVVFDSSAATAVEVGEVRVAFLPAEATVGLGSIIASSAAITTTQTVVKAITIPANTFTVGSVYTVVGYATVTSNGANVVTIRVRVGPTTLTGAIVASINPTATATAFNDPVRFEATITVRTVGATGTTSGAFTFTGEEGEPFAVGHRTDVDTGTVIIDTTVANLLELTAVTAAGGTSITFRQAYIRCEMAS